MIPLKTQAIQTALTGDWDAAVNFNQQILDENPDDIDALNRLAFAYSSLGNIKEARNVYQKVLTLDAQNPIAVRNLRRLSGSQGDKLPANGSIKVNNIFIEEPGKTKVLDLINVADQKILSQLRYGEYLELSIKRMKIFALDSEKQYVGMLPDDIGKRLIKFIDGGNQYESFVKTVNNRKVTVFVKETKRAVKFKYQSSFTSSDKPKFTLDSSMKKLQKNNKLDKKREIQDEDSDTESL